MSKPLQIENLENVVNAFRIFPEEVNKELNAIGIEVGEELTVYARDQANHKFIHRDHNLKKDIGNRVFKNKGCVSISFGLGFYPSQTRVWWARLGENVSYGTILHDGAFDDKFIDEAWDKNETKVNNKFIGGINDLIKRLF